MRSGDVIIVEGGLEPEQATGTNSGVAVSWEPELVTVLPNVSHNEDGYYQGGEPITPPLGGQVITQDGDVHHSIIVRPLPFIGNDTGTPAEIPTKAPAGGGRLPPHELEDCSDTVTMDNCFLLKLTLR